jgi:hypothetical protein
MHANTHLEAIFHAMFVPFHGGNRGSIPLGRTNIFDRGENPVKY